MDRSLYKKNLKFFKKEKPSIYSLIQDINPAFLKINEKPTGEIVIKSPSSEYIENTNQLKNLIAENIEVVIVAPFATFRDKNLKRDWFHDAIIEKWDNVLSELFSVKKIKEKIIEYKKIPLIFLNGIGIGNVINILQKDKISFDYLLIFEPDVYNFLASLYFVDWQVLYKKKKVFLIIGNKKDNVKRGLVASFNQFSPTNAVLFIEISIDKNNEEEKKDFKELLKESIILSLKGWGYYDDEKEAIIHVYENLRRKLSYITKPLPLQKSSNLIIVGSGPSLDETIDFVKKNQENAVIFSCGTAIHRLFKEDIIPDFQIELERPKSRVKYFEDLPEKYRKQITLIAADVVPYELISLYKDAYLFPRADSITQYLLNPLYYPIGISPTVVNTALSIALFLGFENIYFVGVDMGYKSIEKKHARGTIYGSKIKEAKSSSYIKVEGNIENTVYTDEILLWAKNNIEEITKAFSKERNFINISRGAKIEKTNFVFNYNEIEMKKMDKEKMLQNIKNVVSNNYKSFFDIKKEDYIYKAQEFLEKFEKQVHKILYEENIDNMFSLYYHINEDLKKLQNENISIYTLISGTLKHILIKLIYLLYFISKLEDKDKKELVFSMRIIKSDIPSLKLYFEFFKNLI